MSFTRNMIEDLRIKLGKAKPLPERDEPPKKIQIKKNADSAFAKHAAEYTTAILGIGCMGTRYATDVILQFQAELAVAHAAVASQLPENWFDENKLLSLKSRVSNHKQYLLRPDLGRRLDQPSLQLLQEKASKNIDVQAVLADGLSAYACISSGMQLLNSFIEECNFLGMSTGTPMGARYARVWLEDEIGSIVKAKVIVILLGERPGLGTGDGLSAYMVYEPRIGKTDAERNMMSNIHQRGTTPKNAAKRLALLAKTMIDQKISGVNLDLSTSSELKEAAGHVYRQPQKRVQLVELK